jgi:hypothetical protein
LGTVTVSFACAASAVGDLRSRRSKGASNLLTTSRTVASQRPLAASGHAAKGFPMENEGRQMPEHIKLAYEDAVKNVMFFKRQQWVATNYAVLVYAALFVISAEYFSRTDFARNWLGIFAIATFIFHLYALYSFDVAISKFREGLDWIYRTYFTGAEQTNLKLRELRPSVDRVTLGLSLVSFLGLLLTATFMWSVR